MVPERVSLITIGAENLPELRKFYQRLGWHETEISSDGYSVFKTAGVLESDCRIRRKRSHAEFLSVWRGSIKVFIAL